MAQEEHTTFQDVFVMVSPMELIKLLPWCISSVVPSQYINKPLVTATWLGENTPATTAVPEQEGSPVPGPSNSPAYFSETPSPIIPLLPDLPFMGTPLMGCPFTEFLATSTQKKWDHSPSSSFDHHCSKRTCIDSQEVKTGSNHSSTWGNGNTPGLIPEAGPSSEQWEQKTASPPSSPSRAIADPDEGIAAESLWSTGDQASLDSDSPRESIEDSDMDTVSGDCIICSDMEGMSV